MQSWGNIHISPWSLFPQLPALPAGSCAQSLPNPNPPSLTPESSNRASNEFKLEKQGYKQVTSNAGIWDIIPLILDLEARLNFAIGSKRPHSELKTLEKPNTDKCWYEATDCPGLCAFVQASS